MDSPIPASSIADRRAPVLPWPLRLVTWLLIMVLFSEPFAVRLEAVPAAGTGPQPASQSPGRPAPVLTPDKVSVNRTVPKVTPPSGQLEFSDAPTELEFFRARVFSDPLVPSSRNSTPEENRALAAALREYQQRTSPDDFTSLTRFLKSFPDSTWRVAVLNGLGTQYRRAGYFSRAIDAWREAWAEGRNESEVKISATVDMAVGQLAEFSSRLGRAEELEALLQEVGGRTLRGSAAQKMTAAREGLWEMRHRIQRAFLCGPMALYRIRVADGNTNAFHPAIRDYASTPQGISLDKVCALANEIKMDMQIAKRSAGAKIIMPAVVHWKVGHYGAIIRENSGRFLIQDPTFENDFWVTQAALESESSGYFIVPNGPLPKGWHAVTEDEAQSVWGKGATESSDPDGTTKHDPKVPDCQDSKGMARYAFHTMLCSLNITDTPLGYQPPRGPSVSFTATYNQREAHQPASFAYGNLGPLWTHDLLSYVEDDPQLSTAKVRVAERGGGSVTYEYNDNGGIPPPPQYYFKPQKITHSRLYVNPNATYQQVHPDGSSEFFGLPDGNTQYPRKVMLTKVTDPQGNSLSLTYDGFLRVVAVTDALGQVTTFSYELPGDIWKITRVTDPFGRFATFEYDGSFRLIKITDVIGLTSQFAYGSGDFITSLTTPYGTTTFAKTELNRTRSIEATDPLGQKERMEYQDALAIPTVDAVIPSMPAGLANNLLQFRNSFFWDKKAMAEAPGDYGQARLYHWLHATFSPNTTSRVLESTKNALENRVWFTYNNQFSNLEQSGNASPTMISRVLEDGTTQMTTFQYNAIAKVTQSIDPAGRATHFTYAANEIDLLTVRQTNGAAGDLLATLTYNSQHLPLTVTDAAGQVTRMAYNTNGQITAVTNARNEVVTLLYDTNGYLTNLTGALPGATVGLAYDGFGRVRTVTDSDGYSMTTDYDAFDRPTKVTYPDGTFEQIVYSRLDPVLSKDRRGHWTSTTYDALRRVTDVQDSLNRVTHLDWCSCGSLSALIDPLGRVTTWLRDVQGRVTAKLYPDGTQTTYAYERGLGRLKSMTDAKGQQTRYRYNVDNNLQQVLYTNAAVATPTVNFTYDSVYNRLATMQDGLGLTTYGYNAVNGTLGAGRLASVDGPLGNDTITYAYDELGRVLSRAIDNVAVRLAYDALGRVTVVTNALGAFTNSYEGVTARLSAMAYPNGQVTSFSYYGNTNDQRLQTIWHQNGAAATISKFDYTYDADGQIKTWSQQADASAPKVYDFEYDTADQLVGAALKSTGAGAGLIKQHVYGYDKADNRTSEQISPGAGDSPATAVTAGSFNNLNQLVGTTGGGATRFAGRLSEPGTAQVGGSAAKMGLQNTSFVGTATTTLGTNVVAVKATDYSNNSRTNQYQLVVTNNGDARTLSYDLNGNLTASISATRTNTYDWDAANRLLAVESRAGVSPVTRSEFTYDGYSRRVRIVEKTNGLVQSDNRFLWCGVELCEERDASGGAVTKRFFGQGEQLGGTNYFITRDHLGSVREMTDGTGNIRARYDYDPFGRRAKVSGDLEADFAFTGHYFHQASGLHLALFRAYDAESGRWLNRDPIGEEGGINLYGYVGNDPIRDSDLLGLVASAEEIKKLTDAAQTSKNELETVRASLDIALKMRRQLGPLQSRPCLGYSGGQAYNLSQALKLHEVNVLIQNLKNQLRELAFQAAAASAAAQAAIAGGGGAIAVAFSAESAAAIYSAGAGAATVGISAAAVAGAGGVGAGLLFNSLPNPFTGESIGKGVEDTFTYLFFSKKW